MHRIVLVFRRKRPISKEFWRWFTQSSRIRWPKKAEGWKVAFESRGKKKFISSSRASGSRYASHPRSSRGFSPGVSRELSDKSEFLWRNPPSWQQGPIVKAPFALGRHWRFVRTARQVRGASRFSDKMFDISFSFCKITLRYILRFRIVLR